MTDIFNPNTSGIANRTKVALVQSCWHEDIVDEFCRSFIDRFQQLDGRTVHRLEVPGAFEIPLMAKSLASTDEYAAVVCTGLVVDGGIYRHEFVASAVIDGLMRTQLDTGVPVFSGVLTPHDFVSEGRPEFFRQHFVIKGEEVAEACARTLSHYCLEAA